MNQSHLLMFCWFPRHWYLNHHLAIEIVQGPRMSSADAPVSCAPDEMRGRATLKLGHFQGQKLMFECYQTQ